MRKLVLVLFALSIFSVISAKDIDAWKSEKSLDSQYETFKKNLNFWNGFYSFKEYQSDEFFSAVKDTIKKLQNNIDKNEVEIEKLNKEIVSLKASLEETNKSLEASLEREMTLETLGTRFDKNAFPSILYAIIIALILIALFILFLFFRSNKVTTSTNKRYNDLSNEFEEHRKNTLDREIKLNRELQNERNKNRH